MELTVVEKDPWVFRCSEHYKSLFNKQSGLFLRWGKTREEDPKYCPYGPEIADIEITTVCGNGCSYCYKDNKSTGKNMSLETFKQLINKINTNQTLTQVAFGLGATGEENPNLWEMCKFLREEEIVPNGTVANISNRTADKIAKLFGACAVSFHGNKDNCYGSIKKLTDRRLIQTNMHLVIHDDNYDEVLSVVKDIKTDPRLAKLNAVVLLSLKPKGRALSNGLKVITQSKFASLIEYLLDNNIRFGMDSCSSHKYIHFLNKTRKLSKKQKNQHLTYIEPCESFAVFSSYFNVDGIYYPCSFAEKIFDGINVLNCEDFVKDVWNGAIMSTARKKSIASNRKCLLYNM